MRTMKDRADAIIRELNCLALDENEVGANLAMQHPTLQQSAMRMVIGFLRAMAENRYVDGRNEAAVELAQKLMKSMADDVHLPLV